MKSVKEEEETIKRHNLRLLNVKVETPSALAQFQKVNILALKLVRNIISWIILVNLITIISSKIIDSMLLCFTTILTLV